MGLLDGLAKLGVKNVNTSEMYEEKKAETKAAKPAEAKPVVVEEKDFIFAKTYECPICDYQFKALTLKTNKARLVSMDKDLRPIFEGIEPLKYETVCCPRCGYSVMSKYMKPLTPSQKKAVIDNVSQSFSGIEDESELATFDGALERIKLALACAIFKRAKASEKAYICLKGGWLCRAYADHLNKEGDAPTDKLEMLKTDEKEFLDNAYEGFIAARQSEDFPIAGMDSSTLDYLIAVMASERQNYDVASRMIAGILQSPNASNKIKDKARDLKDEVVAKIKEAKNS